jgi:hypothetical protein
MMSIGGCAAADEAGLPADELQVLSIPYAPWFRKREDALVYRRPLFELPRTARTLTFLFF